MCISRIWVVLLNLSILFNIAIWPQQPVSVLIWPHLLLNILFREIHLRTEMNLISQHAHINNPSRKQSLLAWISSEDTDDQFHASFNRLQHYFLSGCIIGSTSVVMSWYTLSRLGIRKLGLMLANLLFLYIFFLERARERAGIYNQTLTSVMGPPRHLSVMIIRHIFWSFAWCRLSWRCARQYACSRWCREWTQHFKWEAYMMCSWCSTDAEKM